MKYHLIIVTISITFLFFGCSEKDPAQSSNETSGQDVKKQVGEALETTGDYLEEQKDDMMDQASQTYEQLKGDTQQLITDIKASGKENWEELNKELDSKLDAVQQQLNELKEAGQDTWKDSKAAFDTAVVELKDAYQKAKAEYQESGAEQ